MYCKNCGASNNDDAKFCANCGSKIEVESTYEDAYDYYDKPVQAEQQEYNYNQSVQDEMTHDDRPSNIYGRKFEAHASGGVEYRKPRKGSSPITKFLIFGVIIGLIGYVYFVFSSNTPIYDVAIGSEVNATTYYPDEPLDYVIASDGILYISYSARDSLYETVYVTVYNNTDNLLVESMNTSIDYEDQVGYFSVDHNWTVGSYQITFEIDGEVVYTYDFEVELY